MMNLTAKVFAPSIYEGERRRGAAAPIVVTGHVRRAQASAYAAVAVPVIERDGLFVPADRQGEDATVAQVAKWYAVRLDDAFAFKLETQAAWWGGVKGVLFAEVHELDLGDGAFLRLLEMLKRRGGPVGLEDLRIFLEQQVQLLEIDLSPRWPQEATAEMGGALEALLRRRAADLDRGLLTLRGGAQPAARLAPAAVAVAEAAPAEEPAADEIVFAVASCQYSAGMLDEKPAHASYERLAARLAGAGAAAWPEYLFLLGDQVYVDATAGLFDPSIGFDRFGRPHQDLRDLFERLKIPSAFMMLDDHEIADNWEPPCGCGEDPLLVEGRRAYLRQRAWYGPPLKAPVGDSPHPLWYEVSRGGFPFFVADTRTERMRRDAASIDSACIMSEAQFSQLLGWLEKQPADRPKFVASPSILLPRRSRVAGRGRAAALRSDAWDGYPCSMQRLLAHIAQNRIEHVVFLSGDEHLSCVARAEVAAAGADPVSILSVHSSALYAPFPFANSMEEDLAASETFPLSVQSSSYTCTVRETRFYPGDGFAILKVARDSKGWRLYCEFDRAAQIIQDQFAI